MMDLRFRINLLVSFFICVLFLIFCQCVNGQEKILTGNIELKDVEGQFGDEFGSVLSLSSFGNMIGVGAPFANQARGKMVLFTRKNQDWTQYTVTTVANLNLEIGSRLGSVVEVEEVPLKLVLVASPYIQVASFTNCGAAYVMRKEDIALDLPSVRSFSGSAGARNDMFFATTASLSQNLRWAFANPNWRTTHGRALVWKTYESGYLADLIGSVNDVPRSFGSIVKLSGNGKRLFECALLTQAEIDGGMNGCMVFSQLEGGNWTSGFHFFTPPLPVSLSLATNYEGTSVAVGLSEPQTTNLRGLVKYFDFAYRNAELPIVLLTAGLDQPNVADTNIDFGKSISMSDDGLRLLVGAPGRDRIDPMSGDPLPDAGFCELYTRSALGLRFTAVDKLWGTQAVQRMGYAVGIGGNVYVCGAPGTQSVFISGNSSAGVESSAAPPESEVLLDSLSNQGAGGESGTVNTGVNNGNEITIDSGDTKTGVNDDKPMSVSVSFIQSTTSTSNNDVMINDGDGVIVGIGAGIGAVVVLIIIAAICLMQRKQQQQRKGSKSASDLLSAPVRTSQRDSQSRSRRNSQVRSRSRSRSSKRQSHRIGSDHNNSNYAAISPLALGNYESTPSFPDSNNNNNNNNYYSMLSLQQSAKGSAASTQYTRPPAPNANDSKYNYIQTNEPISSGAGVNSLYENVNEPLN